MTLAISAPLGYMKLTASAARRKRQLKLHRKVHQIILDPPGPFELSSDGLLA